MTQETTISATMPAGADYTIMKVYKSRGQFSLTYKFNTLLKPFDGRLDIIDLIGEMKKGELALFIQLKNNMSYRNNLSTLSTSEMSASDRAARSAAIAGLVKMDMVRKVKTNQLKCLDGLAVGTHKGTYMMDPHYFIPGDNHFVLTWHYWNQLS